MKAGAAWKSPLHEMTQTTATCLWNDSADPTSCGSIEHGAVGATCNPVIAHTVLKARMDEWRPRIAALIAEPPAATEDEIGWAAVERLSIDAAALLMPAFEAHRGRNGRLSIQTDPRLYRNTAAIVEQAQRFDDARAEHDRQDPGDERRHSPRSKRPPRGASASTPPCRSRCRSASPWPKRSSAGCGGAKRDGHDVSHDGAGLHDHGRPAGRLAEGRDGAGRHHHRSRSSRMGRRRGVQEDLRLFRERGYRTRLLSAAFRNHMHWSELDRRRRRDLAALVVAKALRRQRHRRWCRASTRRSIRASSTTLSRRFADFRRAYDEIGLAVAEFDDFAPTRRTLRQFLAACADLNQLVRDVMLPNPDSK